MTGTQFNYYQICYRKLWLFSNGINMEHTSDLVYEGKLIHESSYPQRSEKYEELEIEGIKIDYYDARNKVIHEIKKSDKIELAHEWQLKYYIYVIAKQGIEGVTGVLEYPTLRHTTQVTLAQNDINYIEQSELAIKKIVASDICPPVNKKKLCNNCSFYEFCYVNED